MLGEYLNKQLYFVKDASFFHTFIFYSGTFCENVIIKCKVDFKLLLDNRRIIWSLILYPKEAGC